MNQKLATLDYGRGFTVLMIAPVHTVLVYSTLAVHNSWLGLLLTYIAEGPGAQLFMMVMGILFAFSADKKSWISITRRVVSLLVLAYALNVFKFLIPLERSWLPDPLLSDLGVHNDPAGMLSLFGVADILHFAAIALLIIYGVMKLPLYPLHAMMLAVIVCFVSPLLWDLHTASPFLNYLLSLLGGNVPLVYFPLFPWLVYPLTGLAIGYWLKHHPEFPTFNVLGLAGNVLWALGQWMRHSAHLGPENFYRTFPADTIYHLGIVLISLSAWDWLSKRVKVNLFLKLLQYVSRRITQVYFIEWVVICWMIPLFGYHRQGLGASIGCILITTGITLALSYMITLAVKYYQTERQEKTA